MNQLIEFFKGLFAYDEWPPRWKCGYWSDFHGWLYIISELMVWTAYFMIPLLIINYFNKKKGIIRFRKVYLLFATFILLCGSTHFLDALMFWIPMYRFNAVVRLATGIVSLLTVYNLFKVLPDLFNQKTTIELEKEIIRRNIAEKKLEEANQNLQHFASIAAHDLQEPLRKIVMFTSRLADHNKDHFDSQSKEYSEKTAAAAKRMQNLINDVLTLSSITENIELEPVDLNIVLEQSIENLEIKISQKSAQIDLEKLPIIHGHQAYLVQLFTNLLSNAIKFNENKPIVKITSEMKDGKVYVMVSDNGIGISQEFHDKLFETFRRFHTRKYEGSGIGLSIVKKIVNVHRGDISVQGNAEGGTTFKIKLHPASI